LEPKEIVRGLDPVDWVQMQLIANLPPEKRITPGLQAQAFAMAALRGTFRKRYPELSLSEINMKVLAHLTPVRMSIK
jgi:hypothetical protein